MDALSISTKIGFSGELAGKETSTTWTPSHLTTAFALKISHAYNIYEERRALRTLSDEMLNDLGISRGDINKECNRSFFDTPEDRK